MSPSSMQTNEENVPRQHQRAWALAGHASQLGYLSIEHAADWADVSPRTIKRWIKAGLPTYQAEPRGKLLLRRADIDQFLTRKQVPTPDLGAMVEEVLAGLSGDGQGGRG